jgi:hypothetical protein
VTGLSGQLSPAPGAAGVSASGGDGAQREAAQVYPVQEPGRAAPVRLLLHAVYAGGGGVVHFLVQCMVCVWAVMWHLLGDVLRALLGRAA